MKYEVPTSFRLGGNTWRVKLVKSIVAEDGVECFGICDADKHIITIALFVHGRPVPEATRYKAYIHESYHAKLATLGRTDDEELVAGLEEMTWQQLKTERYRKLKSPSTQQATPKSSSQPEQS